MSLEACARIVERGDPDRFMATMAVPLAARAQLFPLYAFNVEVSRAPWLTAEPMIAQMRLQWWRDVLDEIDADGPVRSHEVATPLAGVLRGSGASVGPLISVIDAREWDVDGQGFASAGALQCHLEQSAGALMWAAGAVLGAEAVAEPALRDAGFANGVAGWLRAVPVLRAAGRVPLVTGSDAEIVDLAQSGLDRLARAHAARGTIDRVARGALLAGWQTRAILRSAQRDPARVEAGALMPSEFRRRGGLLLRSLLV